MQLVGRRQTLTQDRKSPPAASRPAGLERCAAPRRHRPEPPQCRSVAPRRSAPAPLLHCLERRLLVGRRGLKHIPAGEGGTWLNEGRLEGRLAGKHNRPPQMPMPHTPASARTHPSTQAPRPAPSLTHLMSDSRMGSSSGNSPSKRAVSSRLLLRGATITLACSSTLKLDQVKSGSM